MYEDRLIRPMIPRIFEEDPTSQQRDLEGLYVDVNAVFMPRISS